MPMKSQGLGWKPGRAFKHPQLIPTCSRVRIYRPTLKGKRHKRAYGKSEIQVIQYFWNTNQTREKRRVGKQATQAGQGKTTQARLEALSEGDGKPLEGARQKKDITDSALEKGLQGKHGRRRRGRKMSCWETSQKAPSLVQMRNYPGFKPSSDGGCVET